MMNKFKNKSDKFWFYFLIFVLFVTIVGAFLGVFLEKGIFRQKSISKKYCYIIENGQLKRVFGGKTTEKAYQAIVYYYCNKSIKKGIIKYDNLFEIDSITEVEVLEITEDSLLAKIRFVGYSEMSGGMHYDVVGYVPVFSLHDTLPKYP